MRLLVSIVSQCPVGDDGDYDPASAGEVFEIVALAQEELAWRL